MADKGLIGDYKAELEIKDHSMHWRHNSRAFLALKCHANYPKWFIFVQKVLKRLHVNLKDLELSVLLEHPNTPPRERTMIPGDAYTLTHNYNIDLDCTRPTTPKDLRLEASTFPLGLIFNCRRYRIEQDDNGELQMIIQPGFNWGVFW